MYTSKLHFDIFLAFMQTIIKWSKLIDQRLYPGPTVQHAYMGVTENHCSKDSPNCFQIEQTSAKLIFTNVFKIAKWNGWNMNQVYFCE